MKHDRDDFDGLLIVCLVAAGVLLVVLGVLAYGGVL